MSTGTRQSSTHSSALSPTGSGRAHVVIDVDSHYFEPFEWLAKTDPALAAEVPKTDKLTTMVTTAFGEVFSALPPEYKPDLMANLPGLLRPGPGIVRSAARKAINAAAERALDLIQGAHRPAARIKYLDKQGIDLQFVLPTFAFTPISYIRRQKTALTPQILRAYNTWACQNLDGYTSRLIPATIVDLKTMDREAVLAEMHRVRQLGSRTVLFWPSPVDGKSLSAPDFEWFWSAFEDLGIMPMIHVGAGRPNIDLGWLNNGRDFPLNLASYLSQIHQIPELALTELIASGVLERHPRMRVLVCEFGIDWVPLFLDRCERLAEAAQANDGAGWSLPLTPDEYFRRQVRVSPLQHDPVPEVIEEVGRGVIVFSSDYPHPEGGKDAVKNYKSKFEGRIDPETAEAFFGTTLSEDLAACA